MGIDDALAVGRAALVEGHWDDARAAFESALHEGESPEAFDGLAEVRYWQGDYGTAIDLRERAYAGFRARGETRHPARLAAYHLAFDYLAVHGNRAAASGWLERGRRLAEASGDCPERGWVALACVLATDDPVEKQGHVDAAMDVARRFGDADLEFDALAYEGVLLIERGQVEAGMRRLDEAAAAARGGEVTNHTAVGEIYCKMLLACEMVLDVRRAEQWLEAATSLVPGSDTLWVSAICRMYYGGILLAAGRWAEAEDELTRSVRIYDGSYRGLRSGAVVRLADLRVRQGRLEDAETLLAGHEHDSAAVRVVARLHLARGRPELAVTQLRRHIDRREDGVLSAPTLALLAEAEVAAARLDHARDIGERLEAIARATPVPLLRALAEFAAGIASTDDPADDRGIGHLEAALAGFLAASLPFEEARTRLELARHLSADQPEVAIAEARTALAVFDRIGAAPDADAAASLLRALGARGRTGPKGVGLLSQRERTVLHLLGEGLTNPEIGQRLFISPKTASHHVSNVLAKLGLRNRAEAAVVARSLESHEPGQANNAAPQAPAS